ncbi:MAG: phosphatase PAP2 family protein [Bacteroidota bacterium]
MLKLPAGQKQILLVSLLITAGALVFSLLVPGTGIQIAVNRLNTPFSGQLFRYWTLLGDGGVMLLPVLIAAVFFSLRKGLMLLLAYAFSGLGAQLMKRFIWPDAPRPVSYFREHQIPWDLDLVPGVKIHEWHSFPSGHTATAFAVFLTMALLVQSVWLRYAFLLLAAGVGLSRIWLSQHFMLDVAAGAVWGWLSAVLAWILAQKVTTGCIDNSVAGWLKDRRRPGNFSGQTPETK